MITSLVVAALSRPLFRSPANRHAGFVLAAALCACLGAAQDKPTAPAPDVLVLANGDTLHGKFVSAIQGKVTFHSDVIGDISLGWDKIRELHTVGHFAVLDKNTRLHGRRSEGAIPSGAIAVENQEVRIQVEGVPAPPPIPIHDTVFILDVPTLDREIKHHPSPLSGWNGAAAAGATLVSATQNQYSFSGGIDLVRAVPTVAWLNPRNRTSLGFTGSFAKITEPSYTDSTGAFVPEVTTKSAIYHAGAERDTYFSLRGYALAQVAFDHNYSQDLDLQQIYGGGLGWTVLKTPRQVADLKATAQYVKQSFLSSSTGNENLVGSTFSASYTLHTHVFTFNQNLSYLPAYNNPHAYSVAETNSLAFPAYKNLSFTLGTLDSYLNNPPESLPPTRRNSFQFTMGLSYAIRTKD